MTGQHWSILINGSQHSCFTLLTIGTDYINFFYLFNFFYFLFFISRSVDLVERLIGDIVSTTASYKQLQERESRLSSDFNLAQAQLFPLRKENVRLSRENHQLHVESINEKENLAISVESQKREIKALGDKLNELKYLNVAKEKELRAMEKEKERMKEVNK